MPNTQLILIRHAHTATNGGGTRALMSGITDIPLSDRGRQEARVLGARMRDDRPFDVVYSSPLSRAVDTARALGKPAREVRIADDVREIDCGDVDGMVIEDVKESLPALWAANLRQEDDDFRWPGGETYRELRNRVLRAISDIANRHPHQRVAVVTHAGVIGQLVGSIVGIPPACWERFRPANTSLTELVWNESGPVLVRFDDHSHLAALAP